MQDGNSFMPWYNFPLIDFLQKYIKPDMNIFEYGCGFSTLFYASKKCHVYSVETRPEWVQKVEDLAKENGLSGEVNIIQTKPNEIAKQIHNFKITFDVIVIDSYHRLECLAQARTVYKEGIIILDNSERENLQSAKEIMHDFQCNVFQGNGVNREGISEAKVFFK